MVSGPTHAFAIRRKGRALVLAHDAFEAAVWFLRLETYTIADLDEWVPLAMETDAEIVLRGLYERWAYDYQFLGMTFPKCLKDAGFRDPSVV